MTSTAAVEAVVRELVKALFDGNNGPQRGILLAPRAVLLLYDQE